MDEKNQKKMTDKALEKTGHSPERSKKFQSESIEILNVTRDSYRAPIDPANPVHVKIGNRSFDVINVSKRGIGFLVPGSDIFMPDEKLKSIMLICKENKITMEGRVIHISPYEFGKFICGIEFINLDAKALLRLKEYLERSRIHLFLKQKENQEED